MATRTGRRNGRLPPRGYTLLELAVVMLIISVLAAASINAYSKMESGQRVSTSMDKLVSSLYLAKSLAISNNAMYEFGVLTDPNEVQPQFVGVWNTPDDNTNSVGVGLSYSEFSLAPDLLLSVAPPGSPTLSPMSNPPPANISWPPGNPTVSPMPPTLSAFVFNPDGTTGSAGKVRLILTLYLDGHYEPAPAPDRIRWREVDIYPGGMIKTITTGP